MEQLRREKVDLENSLEHEQEALFNTLGKRFCKILINCSNKPFKNGFTGGREASHAKSFGWVGDIATATDGSTEIGGPTATNQQNIATTAAASTNGRQFASANKLFVGLHLFIGIGGQFDQHKRHKLIGSIAFRGEFWRTARNCAWFTTWNFWLFAPFLDLAAIFYYYFTKKKICFSYSKLLLYYPCNLTPFTKYTTKLFCHRHNMLWIMIFVRLAYFPVLNPLTGIIHYFLCFSRVQYKYVENVMIYELIRLKPLNLVKVPLKFFYN